MIILAIKSQRKKKQHLVVSTTTVNRLSIAKKGNAKSNVYFLLTHITCFLFTLSLNDQIEIQPRAVNVYIKNQSYPWSVDAYETRSELTVFEKTKAKKIICVVLNVLSTTFAWLFLISFVVLQYSVLLLALLKKTIIIIFCYFLIHAFCSMFVSLY